MRPQNFDFLGFERHVRPVAGKKGQEAAALTLHFP
jgi:hypothetical protein